LTPVTIIGAGGLLANWHVEVPVKQDSFEDMPFFTFETLV
jgi:hypothetical protein